MYHITPFSGPQEQLARDLKRVPFCLLDPWFGRCDGVDWDCEHMVEELEGTPRWNRDF
jgi:hypothetical protein